MYRSFLVIAALSALTVPSLAEGISAASDSKVDPAFDLVSAAVTMSGDKLKFSMSVTGQAGAEKPEATGKFEGSRVYAYVWPTSLDTSAAGFGEKEGILALAVTAHPDFDDTPAFDENGDGKANNDGGTWHSHWVVLTKDETCGGGLKVKDIAPGQDVVLPKNAPGVPLFLSSPGDIPDLKEATLEISVPAPQGSEAASFDGVTSGLRVGSTGKAPLLCVTDVFKVISGDLSMPGKIAAE